MVHHPKHNCCPKCGNTDGESLHPTYDFSNEPNPRGRRYSGEYKINGTRCGRCGHEWISDNI